MSDSYVVCICPDENARDIRCPLHFTQPNAENSNSTSKRQIKKSTGRKTTNLKPKPFCLLYDERRSKTELAVKWNIGRAYGFVETVKSLLREMFNSCKNIIVCALTFGYLRRPTSASASLISPEFLNDYYLNWKADTFVFDCCDEDMWAPPKLD